MPRILARLRDWWRRRSLRRLARDRVAEPYAERGPYSVGSLR